MINKKMCSILLFSIAHYLRGFIILPVICEPCTNESCGIEIQ